MNRPLRSFTEKAKSSAASLLKKKEQARLESLRRDLQLSVDTLEDRMMLSGAQVDTEPPPAFFELPEPVSVLLADSLAESSESSAGIWDLRMNQPNRQTGASSWK